MKQNIVIETCGICKTYGKFSAVSDLTMMVERGEIYALVGQNGAGKTTLLKMICGLTPASAGKLELFGQNSAAQLEKTRAKMGSMIETPGFFPYLSAEKNLEYYRIQRGERDKNCVKRALDFVGLSDTGNKKFKNFSLGMKQRLGLALALMNDPEVLVLDEPINGLDPMGIKEFREILLRLNQEKQTTVLISSHILGELSQIATTYGFIRDGKLMEHITADELNERCKSFLRIDVDQPEKSIGVLREECSCHSVEVAGKSTLHVNDGCDKPEILVQALVKNGIMVSQVFRAGISLEQYFVNLIGGNVNA